MKVVKKTLLLPCKRRNAYYQKGESWKLISQQYNLPIRKLKELNGSLKCYYLRPGASLRVN
ncbi:MAG: LysM peptidoglycan-binding domain-containing protein [Sphingobacteriaceae bacterium]|nr:LysM peptidoglycan-binding domain-containing protein [Sphingobacteriaceae bacterium]